MKDETKRKIKITILIAIPSLLVLGVASYYLPWIIAGYFGKPNPHYDYHTNAWHAGTFVSEANTESPYIYTLDVTPIDRGGFEDANGINVVRDTVEESKSHDYYFLRLSRSEVGSSDIEEITLMGLYDINEGTISSAWYNDKTNKLYLNPLEDTVFYGEYSQKGREPLASLRLQQS